VASSGIVTVQSLRPTVYLRGEGRMMGSGGQISGRDLGTPVQRLAWHPGANVEADALGFGGTHFPGIRCHVLMTSPLSSSSSSRYGMSTETPGAK